MVGNILGGMYGVPPFSLFYFYYFFTIMTPEYINLFDRISVYRKDNETIKSNTYSNCIDDLILFKEFCDYFGTMENYKELGGQYPNSLDIAFMSYYKF